MGVCVGEGQAGRARRGGVRVRRRRWVGVKVPVSECEGACGRGEADRRRVAEAAAG